MSLADAHARQSPGRTFVVLGTGAMAYVLLQSLVVPALPTLQAALHTSQSSISWILTAYLLSKVGKPIYGRLHPGDILVVNGGEHVVLYIGNGRVIEAPHTGDHVKYQPVSRFLRELYAARRVIPWD